MLICLFIINYQCYILLLHKLDLLKKIITLDRPRGRKGCAAYDTGNLGLYTIIINSALSLPPIDTQEHTDKTWSQYLHTQKLLEPFSNS